MDEKLKDVLFLAGTEWGKSPTPEQLISALDLAGYVIVPREPTEAMIEQFEWHKPQEAARFYWSWMIDAALKP